MYRFQVIDITYTIYVERGKKVVFLRRQGFASVPRTPAAAKRNREEIVLSGE